MALTSSDIHQQSFGASRHGYDPQEVDVFLEKIATEIDEFNRALFEAKNRVEAAEARAHIAEQQLATRSVSTSSVTEEQISKAFINAQRSADMLKDEARVEAEKTYRDAELQAREIVRDATTQKQRILGEIERLRESCEKFRTEYLSLLSHFSADAKKMMPTIMVAEAGLPATQPEEPAPSFVTENDTTYTPAQKPAADAFEPSYKPAPAAEHSAVEASYEVKAEVIEVKKVEVQAAIDLDDDLDIEEID